MSWVAFTSKVCICQGGLLGRVGVNIQCCEKTNSMASTLNSTYCMSSICVFPSFLHQHTIQHSSQDDGFLSMQTILVYWSTSNDSLSQIVKYQWNIVGPAGIGTGNLYPRLKWLGYRVSTASNMFSPREMLMKYADYRTLRKRNIHTVRMSSKSLQNVLCSAFNRSSIDTHYHNDQKYVN